jgi:hypothetical protein
LFILAAIKALGEVGPTCRSNKVARNFSTPSTALVAFLANELWKKMDVLQTQDCPFPSLPRNFPLVTFGRVKRPE